MSGGPIKVWRDAHKPERVSTPDSKRVCFRVAGRGYCGRQSGRLVADWSEVTCADCDAARLSDEAAAS